MAACKVLLLEDDPDLSDVLSQLINKDSNCLKCHSLNDLIKSKDEVLRSSIAFLDIELGRNCPNGLDAFHWLSAMGYRGRIYFLTAHGKNHPVVRRALAESESQVLAKPVAPQKLLNLISECTL